MINNKSKDVKSFLLFLAIVFGVLVAIMVVIATVNANKARKYDLKIFNDITECKGFLELNDKDTEITVYDKPDADKYLKDLPYTEFFAAEYISKELKFEIFAYEFEDSILAEKYYENAVGNETTINPRYVISGNLRNTTLLVIDGANVYLASYSTKYKHNVESFFATKFNKLLYEETEDGLRPADK